MFHLWINQVVFFISKMFEKHLWKSDIVSKDADHWPASLLKMSIFHRCFSNIQLVKKQLPGFDISEALVENTLTNNVFEWNMNLF